MQSAWKINCGGVRHPPAQELFVKPLIPAAAFLTALLTASPGTLPAQGHIPGQETLTLRPVEFHVPPSLAVHEIGPDEYLVQFLWHAGRPVERPAVVGDFNSWNREALPMEGPDEDYTYTASARIPGGDYSYKFFHGQDNFVTDPLNPDRRPDGYGGNNSILRLGLSALLRDATAERGDGLFVEAAFDHRPQESTYFDLFTPTDALIRFRTLRGDVEGARLHLINADGTRAAVEMQFAAADPMFDFWEYHYHALQWDPQPVAYQFEAIDGDQTHLDTAAHELTLDLNRIMQTPEWARHAIWYQIMVDRFRDGDPHNNPEHTTGTNRIETTHPWTSEWYTMQPWESEGGRTFWRDAVYRRLYGGDFQGVIDKLDYLRDLGVTAIYFNPVFEAHNHHKYNARSYVHADDGYGVAGEFAKSMQTHDALDPATWELNASDRKLVELIDEAHKRGMKVILDGVWNHVGDDHHAFIDVQKNRQNSPFADWFDVKSWDPFVYSGWGGFMGLPEFAKTADDLASPSLKEHIFNVTRRWMDPNGDGDPSDGIDGWRLDVPMHLPFGFWEDWVALVKGINPNAYIVGEVWDPAEEWLQPGRFDAVMNYQFAKAAFPYFANDEQKTTASEFDAQLARLRLRYPRNSTYVLQNLYDSHDTDRWVSRIANPDMVYDGGNRIQDSGPGYMDQRPDPLHYQRMKLMAVFQATYIGAPMIWYGTEVGMFGADDPRTRMPMWWDDLMPYDSPDYIIMPDVRDHFRALFALRHSEELLRTGDFTTALAADEQDTYAYFRHAPMKDAAILVVLNNSDEPQSITVTVPERVLEAAPQSTESLFGEPRALAVESDTRSVSLEVPALSGVAIKVGG
jgi:cyclomaltodextrinase